MLFVQVAIDAEVCRCLDDSCYRCPSNNRAPLSLQYTFCDVAQTVAYSTSVAIRIVSKLQCRVHVLQSVILLELYQLHVALR